LAHTHPHTLSPFPHTYIQHSTLGAAWDMNFFSLKIFPCVKKQRKVYLWKAEKPERMKVDENER